MRLSKAKLAWLFLSLAGSALAAPQPLDVMPEPAQVEVAAGQFAVTSSFSVTTSGWSDERLHEGIGRALTTWERRTGLAFPRSASADLASRAPGLVISCAEAGPALPTLGEDESYALEISPTAAQLRARTVVGALRGLATLTQLLQSDSAGWFFPAVSIHDEPRFPWRGLMIDVCRHWQPIEVIERNLDGMALVKLNVLHLHLTDDQGFRIESRTHPELQAQGSDGHFFTQAQIREIIAYAAARGIRVVPEFDIPGHATSWVVSHPELASAPGPYQIERHWGVFDPVLDPTNEATYTLLGDFLGEMAALFPDPYLHIGGDENNGVQWDANPRIQAYIRDHHLGDDAGLHAYFNQRISAILARHGKHMIGWDEILSPALPKGTVIQSWRGKAGLVRAAQMGFQVVLSNGYYIDLCYPASDHYRVDPLPADTPLTAEQQKLILGGEATMWSEWVTPETIDTRIWPRTAAIAERFWSPRDVDDVGDMYRRLIRVDTRLEEIGLERAWLLETILRHLAGDSVRPDDLAYLRMLVESVEPVKHYERGHQEPDHVQSTPLRELADAALPESGFSRDFSSDVRRLIDGKKPADPAVVSRLRGELLIWHETGAAVAGRIAARSAPSLRDSAVTAEALAEASAVGLRALSAIATGPALDRAHEQSAQAILDRAAQPHAAVELPMIPALRELVSAAGPP